MADLTRGTPHHSVSAHGTLGSLRLDVQAELHAPWTILFGPSGSGKSTILRAIAGLTPELTTILRRHSRTGWQTLEDPTTLLAPERRQLAFAPQHAVLFPHLTVRENIAFASTVRKGQPAAADLVQEATALFNLELLANRRPDTLSGGERQRVSLARAFAVPNAQLVLLDEPFAGVDRALRDDLIPRLQTWLRDRSIPVLSVTHDVDEALLLGADVLRLADGRNTAQGPAPEVLAPEIERLSRLLNRTFSAP